MREVAESSEPLRGGGAFILFYFLWGEDFFSFFLFFRAGWGKPGSSSVRLAVALCLACSVGSRKKSTGSGDMGSASEAGGRAQMWEGAHTQASAPACTRPCPRLGTHTHRAPMCPHIAPIPGVLLAPGTFNFCNLMF